MLNNYNRQLQSNNTDLQTILNTINKLPSSSGGSSSSFITKDINFYDYNGTLLYSYTLEEVQALTKLPKLPTIEGLICQGWNYDLETIKSYHRAINVGATYITDDGKTRLYIRIAAEGRMNVPLYFSQTLSNGVTIDWGDGSATQTLSGTGNVNTTHTYTDIGNYVITLDVTSGCTLGLGGSYGIMGAASNLSISVYCNMLQKIEIGNGVTSIGDDAFDTCYSLTSITIPNSVTSIGNRAFKQCYSLASIIIPNGITSIGNFTVYDCHSLTNIIIPDGITSIGKFAFSDCYSLTSITIPNSVTSIDSDAFFECYSLANIIIPNSVTSIGNSAFRDCHSLTNIIIPDGVTSIDMNTFCDCHSLTNIIIPDGVTSLGYNAFYNCYSLASIIIPDSVTSIDSDAFYNCHGIAIYDFTSHTSVPTLSNINVFYAISPDCIIKVPAALHDEWIAATNWSTYASQIVAA